jgi:hypothetical protein
MVGCSHTEPFGTRTFDTDQPFEPGPPVRLTLNRGPDREGAWVPDGSAIVYSTQLIGRRDGDVCLAVLPPTGGRQRALTCDLSPAGGTVTDAIESAAPGANGGLAFVAATSSIGAMLPNDQGLALATLDDPADWRLLISVPYTIPGGRHHGGISQLRFAGGTRTSVSRTPPSTSSACEFGPPRSPPCGSAPM